MLNCDLHIHTIASGHAFNTVDECISYALDNKYCIIGFSDHGPSMEGASHSGYFEMLYRLPKHKGELMILYGCEANILDESGKLDLDDDILKQLDYVMAGLHKRTPYKCNDYESNTRAIVNTILSGKVNIITHPVSWNFAVDITKVIDAAMQKKVILEANKTILLEAITRGQEKTIKEYRKLFQEANEAGVNILLGSDAHHVSEMYLSDQDIRKLSEVYNLSVDLLLNMKPLTLLEKLGINRS